MFPESTIKNIFVRTAPSLILGPPKLQTSEGTGAHHLSSDAIRAAESAQMLPSRKVDGELGGSSPKFVSLYVIDPKIPLSFTLSPKGRGDSFKFPSLEGRGYRGG